MSQTILNNTTEKEVDDKRTAPNSISAKIGLINDTLDRESKAKEARYNVSSNSYIEKDLEQSVPTVGEQVKSIIGQSSIRPRDESFVSRQKWFGTITNIGKLSFEAKLTDLNKGGTYEIGEFDIEDISPGDRDLIAIGAGFYWSIGNSYDGTQKRKESVIRFQRLILWTEDDMNKAVDDANEMFNFLSS